MVARMFPRTLSAAMMIIGAVWLIQGAGIVDTGSFMDREPLWAWLGAGLILAGAVTALVKRKPR